MIGMGARGGDVEGAMEAKSVAQLLDLIAVVRDEKVYQQKLLEMAAKLDEIEKHEARLKKIMAEQQAQDDERTKAHASARSDLDGRESKVAAREGDLIKATGALMLREEQIKLAVAQTNKAAEEVKGQLDVREANLKSRDGALLLAQKQLDADRTALAVAADAMNKRAERLAAAESEVNQRKADIETMQAAIKQALSA